MTGGIDESSSRLDHLSVEPVIMNNRRGSQKGRE